MGIFAPNINREPLTPPSSATTERILQTYEHMGLDSEQTMLVGSAAAALYGVFLDPYDTITGRASPRPSDLDFSASPLYMQNLYAALPKSPDPLTPESPWVARKDTWNARTAIRIHTPEPDLPIDMLTNFRDGRDDLVKFHKNFLAYHEHHSRPINGSPMRIITMQALMRELRLRATVDPKAATDLAYVRDSQMKR